MKNVLHPGMFEAPVLVWTVGKVASSSIYATLQHHGHDVLHVHYLGDWHLAHQVNRMYLGRRLPMNIETSLRFRHGYDRGLYALPIKIVTVVRDPLARNMSAYFENLEHFSKGVGSSPEAHTRNFMERYPHRIVLDWFDDEVRDVTGIDFRNLGFDPAKGWAIYRDSNIELLVMRAEDADDVKLQALSTFFETPISEMIRANDAEDKQYRELYRAFKQRIELPQSHIDEMYDNAFSRTFWSAAELQKMKSAWRIAPERTEAATVDPFPDDVLVKAKADGDAAPKPASIPPTLREKLGPFAGENLLGQVRSDWAISTEGFDRQARLRFSFHLEHALTAASLSLRLHTANGALVTTFEPRANNAAFAPGRHVVALSIMDLPLAAGTYFPLLRVSDHGKQIASTLLTPLIVPPATADAENDDLVVTSYRWTQNAITPPTRS